MRKLALYCQIIAIWLGTILIMIGFVVAVLLVAAHPGGLMFAPDRICIVGEE